MPECHYRTAMYEDYVTVQAQDWVRVDAHSSAMWREAALGRLREWLPESKQSKCLDLGCGSGRFLHALRDAGYTDLLWR